MQKRESVQAIAYSNHFLLLKLCVLDSLFANRGPDLFCDTLNEPAPPQDVIVFCDMSFCTVTNTHDVERQGKLLQRMWHCSNSFLGCRCVGRFHLEMYEKYYGLGLGKTFAAMIPW